MRIITTLVALLVIAAPADAGWLYNQFNQSAPRIVATFVAISGSGELEVTTQKGAKESLGLGTLRAQRKTRKLRSGRNYVFTLDPSGSVIGWNKTGRDAPLTSGFLAPEPAPQPAVDSPEDATAALRMLGSGGSSVLSPALFEWVVRGLACLMRPAQPVATNRVLVEKAAEDGAISLLEREAICRNLTQKTRRHMRQTHKEHGAPDHPGLVQAIALLKCAELKGTL